MKRFQWIFVLSIIAMLTATLFPTGSVLAEPGREVAGVPTLKAPLNAILTKTPTYTWTKVTSATHYQYQVYKSTTKLSDLTLLSSTCGSSTCSDKPALTLGYNVYKWRARAKVGGVWKAWSAYKTFSVSPPGFNSSFNGTMSGWAKMGDYNWQVNDSEVFTNGVSSRYSNIYRTSGKYSDFDYSVRIKRSGLNNGISFIDFRTGDEIGTNNSWYPGYIFGYSETQFTYVGWVDEVGTGHTLFTQYDTSMINTNDWNVLRVVAYGNLLNLFINDHLITTLIDNHYNRGYVGVSAYSTMNVDHVVEVDWAKLTVLLKAADFERAIQNAAR
jgi:hypothetical protein